MMKILDRPIYFIVMLTAALILSACGSGASITAPTAAPATAAPAPRPTTPPAIVPTVAATAPPTATGTPVPDVRAFIDQVANGPHDTVKAADGSAELLIPNGALPPGKTASDITVTKIDPAQLQITINGQSPLSAYQMEPDGLQFDTPIVMRITGDVSPDGRVPSLYTLSGAQVNPLSPVSTAIDASSGRLTLSTVISHFSEVIAVPGEASVVLSNVGDQLVDVPFDVQAIVYVGQARIANY